MKTLNIIGYILLTAIYVSSCKKENAPHPATGTQNISAASKSADSLSLADVQSKVSPDLVAWYPFLGNANDASGNNINGTLFGYTDPQTNIAGPAPVLTADKNGHPNAAYSFNGSSAYIYTNSFFADTLVSEFSIYVRFKAGSNGTLLATGDIYRGQPATGLTVNADNSIYFTWQDTFPSQDYALLTSAVSTGPVSVASNTWIDVVVNFKNSVLTIYRNGVLAGTATTTFPAAHFGRGGLIGTGMARYPGDFYNGAIDEVKLYDKPVTVEGVTYLVHHDKIQ